MPLWGRSGRSLPRLVSPAQSSACCHSGPCVPLAHVARGDRRSVPFSDRPRRDLARPRARGPGVPVDPAPAGGTVTSTLASGLLDGGRMFGRRGEPRDPRPPCDPARGDPRRRTGATLRRVSGSLGRSSAHGRRRDVGRPSTRRYLSSSTCSRRDRPPDSPLRSHSGVPPTGCGTARRRGPCDGPRRRPRRPLEGRTRRARRSSRPPRPPSCGRRSHPHRVARCLAAQATSELAASVRQARRAATSSARTAPVKMLFPLVFLVLPAFLLLTVVPVLLTTVRSIG